MAVNVLAVALLLLATNLGNIALAAVGQQNDTRSPVTIAAVCLGGSEASLTYLVKIIQSSARQPGFDTTPLKREAAAKLLRIERLTRYLTSHGQLSNERYSWAVLEARQQGIALTEQCFQDQFTVYVPCQNACQQQNVSQGARDECSAACKLPASCSVREESCEQFERGSDP